MTVNIYGDRGYVIKQYKNVVRVVCNHNLEYRLDISDNGTIITKIEWLELKDGQWFEVGDK